MPEQGRLRHPMWGALGAALMLLGLADTAGGGDMPSARAGELERLVRQDCGSCHGMRLTGGLGPDIRAPALEGHLPEGVAQIILDGVPGTAMPPWRPLISEEDALWIADYLLKTGRE